MEKIKVLQLVEDLKIGGAERVIANIAVGLDRQKYVVSVWCIAQGGEIADELKEKGIKVKTLNIFSYYNPFNILKLAYLLRKAKPDIVHTHGYFASVIGRIAAKLASVPIIFVHVHTAYWDTLWLKKRRHVWIEKFLNLFTNKIICCSNWVREFIIEEEKCGRDKAVVVYNGIEEVKSDQGINKNFLRKSFGISSGELVVGIIASLKLHKGHRYFFEAAKSVLKISPQIKFLAVGNGPLRKTLEELTHSLKIDANVRFVGQYKDVFQILSIIDLLILPSVSREGLGLSLIEAMAMARPVIATTVGGVPEAVNNGITGLLIPPRDSGQLANAMCVLLQDSKKRQEMGRAGRMEFEKKFQARIMVRKIEELYKNVFER